MSNFKFEQMDMGSSDIDSFLTTASSEHETQHVGSSLLGTLDVPVKRDFNLDMLHMGSVETFQVETQKRTVTAAMKGRTKVASVGQLAPFMRLSADTLIHKSQRDLWTLRKEADGDYYIERLFDDNGSPLKG